MTSGAGSRGLILEVVPKRQHTLRGLGGEANAQPPDADDSVMLTEVVITIALLGMVDPSAPNCDVGHFYECVAQVTDFADGYSFQISTASQLRENCDVKMKAVECANEFVSKCMKREEKDVFELTTGGKATLVQELCKDGSDINVSYLKHIDCWEKIANDTQYCNEMFEQSQHILMQDDIIETLRVFHACCNFDWHKKCKSKAAETKCSSDASDYVEQVSTLLGGRILKTLCGGTFASCYDQLYSVKVENLDERYSKSSIVSTASYLAYSLVLVLALCTISSIKLLL